MCDHRNLWIVGQARVHFLDMVVNKMTARAAKIPTETMRPWEVSFGAAALSESLVEACSSTRPSSFE